MYEVQIDRNAGGIRLMLDLIEMGDLASLQAIYERNESRYATTGNKQQLIELLGIRSEISLMSERELREGAGACLVLGHPSVIGLYQRSVERIVAIVEARAGIMAREAPELLHGSF